MISRTAISYSSAAAPDLNFAIITLSRGLHAEDTFTLTLSDQADIEWIRTRVRNGQFASETEALKPGICLLCEYDDKHETWLRETGIACYEGYLANPTAIASFGRGSGASLLASQRTRLTIPVILPVVFSDQAPAHLDNIEAYRADRFSPRNAETYIDRIVSACMGIGKASCRGTKREDIGVGVRTMGFERRVPILFVVETERVVILGIGYAGRSPRSLN